MFNEAKEVINIGTPNCKYTETESIRSIWIAVPLEDWAREADRGGANVHSSEWSDGGWTEVVSWNNFGEYLENNRSDWVCTDVHIGRILGGNGIADCSALWVQLTRIDFIQGNYVTDLFNGDAFLTPVDRDQAA
jgi:hypothetical protein